MYRIAVRRLQQAVVDHLAEEQWPLEELDQVIFHQANGRMIAQLCRMLGIVPERCVTIIEHVGNTSSASIAMALDYANRNQRLLEGNRILLGTFGGGLTWATALMRWG